MAVTANSARFSRRISAARILLTLPAGRITKLNAAIEENQEMRSSSRAWGIAAAALAVGLMFQTGGQARAAEGGEVLIHASKVDITHGQGAEPIDQMDVVVTFSNKESADREACENTADNPVAHGLVLKVREGMCGAAGSGAQVTVPSFRPIRGTSSARFEGVTIEGANVDALLRKLPTQTGTCGTWNLTLDAVPVNLSAVTVNPVAVSVSLPDGSTGCVTVSNATIDR